MWELTKNRKNMPLFTGIATQKPTRSVVGPFPGKRSAAPRFWVLRLRWSSCSQLTFLSPNCDGTNLGRKMMCIQWFQTLLSKMWTNNWCSKLENCASFLRFRPGPSCGSCLHRCAVFFVQRNTGTTNKFTQFWGWWNTTILFCKFNLDCLKLVPILGVVFFTPNKKGWSTDLRGWHPWFSSFDLNDTQRAALWKTDTSRCPMKRPTLTGKSDGGQKEARYCWIIPHPCSSKRGNWRTKWAPAKDREAKDRSHSPRSDRRLRQSLETKTTSRFGEACGREIGKARRNAMECCDVYGVIPMHVGIRHMAVLDTVNKRRLDEAQGSTSRTPQQLRITYIVCQYVNRVDMCL